LRFDICPAWRKITELNVRFVVETGGEASIAVFRHSASAAAMTHR
jgi:hypothetical protein